jgi:hypothetical protein
VLECRRYLGLEVPEEGKQEAEEDKDEVSGTDPQQINP